MYTSESPLKDCPVNLTLTALNLLKNLLKPIAAAVSALALSVTPIEAKVDSGTYELIQTVQDLGYTVHINSPKCRKHDYAGMFIPADESIHLCKGKGPATADEHDTVRHEVWHLVQYCGTPKTARAHQPYTQDKDVYINRIRDSLTEGQIDRILEAYLSHVEIVELEAFAAAQALSAAEIQDILVKVCPTPQRFTR